MLEVMRKVTAMVQDIPPLTDLRRDTDSIRLGSLIHEICIADSQLRDLIKNTQSVRKSRQHARLVMASSVLHQVALELSDAVLPSGISSIRPSSRS
jgi:hypothetical protein